MHHRLRIQPRSHEGATESRCETKAQSCHISEVDRNANFQQNFSLSTPMPAIVIRGALPSIQLANAKRGGCSKPHVHNCTSSRTPLHQSSSQRTPSCNHQNVFATALGFAVCRTGADIQDFEQFQNATLGELPVQRTPAIRSIAGNVVAAFHLRTILQNSRHQHDCPRNDRSIFAGNHRQ